MGYLPNEDRLTKALNIIEWEHHEVHAGNTYTVSFRSAAVANNGYLDLHIVGTTKDAHVKITYSCEGKVLFKTYSATTYTVVGTAITPWNRNMCSTNTAVTTFYHTPTINVLGSQRVDEFVGTGGAAAVRAGGVGGSSIETVVNPTKDLLLRLQNVSGSASDLQFTINFYETDE